MNPVLIVGAGMAGLSCALHLHRAGAPFLLLEGAETVGGRVRTDVDPEGFLLDRGFQVLLSSYPEVRREVDLDALQTRAFRSGAVLRLEDHSETRLADPFSEPWLVANSLFSPVGTVGDKWRILRLLLQVLNQEADTLLKTELPGAPSTRAWLQEEGWSPRMIQRFFVPFFGGVFLDRTLAADARFFRFVFQQFVLGRALLPARGMQALPEQLAARLPAGALRLQSEVRALQGTRLTLATGEVLEACAVVLAVDEPALLRLLPDRTPPRQWAGTTCTYFAAETSPARGDRYLRLNAFPDALAHNVCVPSDVAPSYAPAGSALVSVCSHGPPPAHHETFHQRLRTELRDWFGPEADSWRHLRTYRIANALPAFTGKATTDRTPPGVWVCGDHTTSPSLHGAMASGRTAAQQVLRHL